MDWVRENKDDGERICIPVMGEKMYYILRGIVKKIKGRWSNK